MATVAEEYGVPVQSTQPLALNPAVAALTNLLHLAPDFPWRQTFDALRSPYIRQTWLNAQELDLLDQLTRQRPVVAGRKQWHYALRPLENSLGETGDDEIDISPLAATLPRESLLTLASRLKQFFDCLTPPKQATYREFALWLHNAILGPVPDSSAHGSPQEDVPPTEVDVPPPEQPPSLYLVQCCSSGPLAQRDLAALTQVIQVLRRLVEATDLVPPAGNGAVPWRTFQSEFLTALAVVNLTPKPGLRFTPLEGARDQTTDYLFVLGLSEGEFPRPPQPDLFYAPGERGDPGAPVPGGTDLPLRRFDPAEDASLWWQVVNNCQRRLTLLRPRLDESGAPWLPSPYWEAVLLQISGLKSLVEEPLVAAPPSVGTAASRPELLTALALAGAQQVPPEIRPQWQAASNAYQAFATRQSWESPPGIYEGIISAPDLLAELRQRFGPEHGWSVSRLNRYGNCPYGYFAQFVLALEPRPDPQEGLDVLQRGSLLHAALEKLYNRLTQAELTPCPAHQEAILVHLAASCDEILAHAPQRFGFRAGDLWQYEGREIQRLLTALVS